ncbi:MAG: adenosylmethionine decarboxylase [Chloroflexi bacterium]|nr:adenosylmethionine decarboxylase [Chloroflexota bacterium]
MNALGIHVILELRECNPALLNDYAFVRSTMIDAANSLGATIIGESFHRFQPIGITGVVAIAESHLSIHTWPEYRYAAADIFTCGTSVSPREAANLLIHRFQCKDPDITELERGKLAVLATADR